MPKLVYPNGDQLAQIRVLMNENEWFHRNQPLLLWMANTRVGRDLLVIPQHYPRIILITKSSIHSILEFDHSLKIARIQGHFEVGARFGNCIRTRWEQFNAMARYYYANVGIKVPVSPLTLAHRAVFASTLTAYPDPDPESTTTDGFARRTGVNETFSTIRTSAGNHKSDTDPAGEGAYLGSTSTSNQYGTNQRSIFGYVTSVIGTDNVDSGTHGLTSDRKGDQFSQSVCLAKPAPGSSTSLANSDYNIASWTMTDQADRIAISAWPTDSSTRAVHTLNATGIASVNKSGVTWYGIIVSADMDNSAPTWSSSKDAYGGCLYAEQSGTSAKDPQLIINYSTPTANLETLLNRHPMRGAARGIMRP